MQHQATIRAYSMWRVWSLLLLCLLAGCGGGAESRPASPAGLAPIAQSTTPDNQKQATPEIQPSTGWYWNPAEGGRGFAIERQGDKLFIAAFLYETSGAPTWYVGTLFPNANSQYAGEFRRYTGGQSLLGAFKTPADTKVADVILTFSTTNQGVLQATPVGGAPVNIAIERFAISSPAFLPSSVAFANGWYWNETEGGRGFFIEVQGTQAFIGSFMYDTNGQPIWYVSTASVEKLASVAGLLKQYAGGQSLAGAFKAPAENATSPGRMSFDLASNGSGQMVLPNGKPVPMKPFAFNGGQAQAPVATACPEGQFRSNGACVTLESSVILSPQIMLSVGLVGQLGQTYQMMMCYGGPHNCVGMHVAQFVSYEDLRDPQAPPILAYVDRVMTAYRLMMAQMAAAGTMPSATILRNIFGDAVSRAIANQSQTAEEDARKALTDRGYLAPQAGGADSGTINSAATACTLAPNQAQLGSGPIITYTASSPPPANCYKNRLSTFGWTGSPNSTVADACQAAQNPARNADLPFFKAQSVSACYCKAKGKVNTVTMDHVCHVFFDAGK